MPRTEAPGYEPSPCYPTVGGQVVAGWAEPVQGLSSQPLTLSIDGPAVLDWHRVAEEVCRELSDRGRMVERFDVRTCFTAWPDLVTRTSSAELADDPDFERLAAGDLSQLLDHLPRPTPPATRVLVVFGPGSALAAHDTLWYVDLPKRFAEAELSAGRGRNLGQAEQDGPATTKRLFYVDWPLLDRHRDAISARVDRWFDVQRPDRPTSMDQETFGQTVQALARRPFRTRPTFNTTPWGGHWAQRRLGMNSEAPNTALGYELIAPESGVLCGDGDASVELPFQLVVASHPVELLGAPVHAAFGTSFPIRFDYLDTVDGGNLSVHCHPRHDYMSDVFGWPYTQHETYYMMVGGEESRVYLGLHQDVDVEAFQRDARQAQEDGRPFDIERHVQVFPATPHQLFCVPAGTPHGSGAGNVVLEVSATPYLYSLRFFDWLRRDAQDRQRPVHVEHAFTNLDTRRVGDAVRTELLQEPRTLRQGNGWREELLGALPDMFFQVRRLVLNSDVPVVDDATEGFHVLNVVEGEGVRLETSAGTHTVLAYAETLVVPAAVGRYQLHRLGDVRVRLVKSLVC